MKTYNKRKWLNSKKTPSTGSVCCYVGRSSWNKKEKDMFIEVSDCHNSARLHRSRLESKKDFVKKLKALRNEIDLFISEIEANHIVE